MKNKGIIVILILLIICGAVVIYNKEITNFIISNFLYTKEASNYTFNRYSKREDYEYFNIVNDFNVENKEELLNTIYTIVDSGATNFTFYCSDEYVNCMEDVIDLSTDSEKLTVINNFVHPFNSYNKLLLSTNSLGKVSITVEKQYSDEEIEYIENELNNIINKIYKPDMSINEKIKVFHDYIINTTSYDQERAELIKNNVYNSNEINSHKANGVLENHLALCSGYTDLMSIYLTKLGIKNYKIANDKHVWNAVYINNNWLHLDLTWDDPVTTNKKEILLYDFYLITTGELEKLDSTQHIFNYDIYSEFAAIN